MNFYGVLLASSRNMSDAVESKAKLQAITVTAAQNDPVKHVKQKIHENTVIGSTVQVIVDWVHANKLMPLQFDNAKDFNCHRALAKNVIGQLLTSQRLSVLFQDLNGATNATLANAIARLALVAMDLDESISMLATVTEALLICNDCSALNFIHFSVNQNTSMEKLPHIQQSMEFETLLMAAGDSGATDSAFWDQLRHSGNTPSNESIERIAISALERINRLQAAAGFIVPTSMHDIAFEKLGRRISNSSTLTSGSSVCLSPSISSASTSDTSLTSFNLANKECVESHVSENMLQPNEATYYDITKFKTDLLQIKLEADHLLNQVIIPLSKSTFATKAIGRIKQVNQAFIALIAMCCETESALNSLQYGFTYDQLAIHIASRLIDEAYCKLHQQTSIENYQESDFKSLATSIDKVFKVTSSVLEAFCNPTAISNSYYSRYSTLMQALMDKCAQLALAYKSIDSVYKGVAEIRATVQEGHNKLKALQYDETTSLRDISTNMAAVQTIFATIYNCSTQKLQPLYDALKQQISFDSTSEFQSEEKIVINMVNRLFEDIDSIKMQIKIASRALVHLNDKQQAKIDIKQAKSWVQAMNYSLGLFIALEALFSLDSLDADQEVLQDRYSDFQEQFNEFTLTSYNKICSYFTEDYDAGLNYQKLGDTCAVHCSKEQEYKLFDDLQQMVDQTSKLLSYTHRMLVQRRAVTEYLYHVKEIQDSIAANTPLPASSSYEHVFACFNRIEYPQLNIDGLFNMFYYYHHELYISLSQTKVNLIANRL